ncbi:MAG: hypothetical protein NZZ60_05865 [Bacteroidia bacterium]|nr:hypothetical protein [Bacteroidia bacterium]MCX7652247.1 hypothetical protein [Bacteroidia bacterium]MDW8416509.1 hypothetical protein [Bacteroidia bacterium]
MRVGSKALAELEALFRRNGYTLRYLKGAFHGGPCRLYENKMVVINAVYPPAGRVRALAAIAEQLGDKLDLTPAERALIHRLAG